MDSKAYKEYLADKLEAFILDMPVHLTIDGKSYPVTTEESDQGSCEINLEIKLGIKRMIQRNPAEYIDDLHYFLFSEDEITDLLIRGGK